MSGKKDLDLYKAHELIALPDNHYHYPNPLIYNRGDSALQIIQGGSLRTKMYLSQRPSREAIFNSLPTFDPKKKTLLYMPSFSTDTENLRKDYCSVPFFTKVIKNLKNRDAYNFIIKLHPNLREEPEMLIKVNDMIVKYKLNVHVNMCGEDYLPYMDIADVMVSDRTSAAFDYLYFDKPLLFLDHIDECPDKISFDDYFCSYWLYQCGEIIGKKNLKDVDKLIEGVIANDTHQEIRQKCKAYCFNDNLSVKLIMNMVLFHPKGLQK